MFAPTAPFDLSALPAWIAVRALASGQDAPKDDGSNVSPYLRRPLRSLKEAEKARERKGGRPAEKESAVNEQR